MKNKQKLGLIERCFLAGGLALGGAGCIESLTPLQEQRLVYLTEMAVDQQMQQQRNDAIRNSRSEVNVYVGEGQNNNIELISPETHPWFYDEKGKLKVYNEKGELERN